MLAVAIHLALSIVLAAALGAVTAWRVRGLRDQRRFASLLVDWRGRHEQSETDLSALRGEHARALEQIGIAEATRAEFAKTLAASEREASELRERIETLEAALGGKRAQEQARADELQMRLARQEARERTRVHMLTEVLREQQARESKRAEIEQALRRERESLAAHVARLESQIAQASSPAERERLRTLEALLKHQTARLGRITTQNKLLMEAVDLRLPHTVDELDPRFDRWDEKGPLPLPVTRSKPHLD